MKRTLQVTLFFLGLAIQFLSLFADHAEEVPWILKWIAPSYYDASVGIKKLENGQKLTQADEGIHAIERILINAFLADLSKNSPQQPISKTVSESLFVSKLWTGTGAVLSGNNIGIYVSFEINSKTGSVPQSKTFAPPSWMALKEEVEKLKQPNILIFCFGLFAVGAIMEVVAFFSERSESRKNSKRNRKRTNNPPTDLTKAVEYSKATET